MGMLARLQERTVGPKQRLGRDLRAAHADERRLAGALRDHATRVPYASMTIEVVRLADRADGHAATLAHELRVLTGGADPVGGTLPRGGRNHWERMTAALADVEALQRRYRELALRWDVRFPAPAATFAQLSRSSAATAVALRSLIARADPHAAD
jgi:hypothetical protein